MRQRQRRSRGPDLRHRSPREGKTGPPRVPQDILRPVMNSRTKSKLRVIFVLLVLLAIAAGLMDWYKLHRDVPQPAWITATSRDNFLYGSTGGERDAGIPYWI